MAYGVKRLLRTAYKLGVFWEVWICHSQLHTTRLPANGRGEGPTRAQICACVYICPGCWTSPLGDTTACLGLEEPEVSWTDGRSRWPLFCLKKWGVNLLLSSTLNAEQWIVCLNLGVWPPWCCQCILQQPYNKAFISTSAFSPVFHILQIPSTSIYFYHCIPSAKLHAGQEMWSVCAFVSS